MVSWNNHCQKKKTYDRNTAKREHPHWVKSFQEAVTIIGAEIITIKLSGWPATMTDNNIVHQRCRRGRRVSDVQQKAEWGGGSASSIWALIRGVIELEDQWRPVVWAPHGSNFITSDVNMGWPSVWGPPTIIHTRTRKHFLYRKWLWNHFYTNIWR